jgi:phytoene dehydrogenase-like protein
MLQPETINELGLEKFGFESYVRDPQFTAPMPDGRYLTIYPDMRRTLPEVAKFSKKDAEVYPKFEEDAGFVGETLRRYYLRPPTDWSWGDFAAEFDTPEKQRLFGIFVMGSLRDMVNTYFESDALQGTNAYAAAGNFIGPSAPGSAFLKVFHGGARIGEDVGCFGYIRGGMGQLSAALETIFKHHGGELSTNSPVAKAVVKDGRATGVVLENGDEVEAGVVLSNLDPHHTLLGLVGEEHLPPETSAGLRRYKTEGSTYKLNAAIERLPRFTALGDGDQTALVKGGVVISPSLEYLETAYEEGRQRKWSRRPFVLVHFQSITDPSLAPEGKHTMTLCGDWSPYTLAEGPWTDERRQRFADDVLDTVAEHAPDIRDVLIDYEMLVPPDIEKRFGIHGGHTLHGDLMPGQMLSLRPIAGMGDYRLPVKGMYLCGAGAHPGGYVSCTPGRNAASVVLGDVRGSR